jgi:hypothetical protein
VKLLRRLIELFDDLGNIQCSRTEAWRRIGRLPRNSTEPKSAPAALAKLSTVQETGAQ